MGDASHQARRSDHNQGNAIDITNSVIGCNPLPGIAQAFAEQMRDNPIGGRLTYIIFFERIASASSRWLWVPYIGRNSHITHAHFSIKATHRDVLRAWSLP